MTMSISESIMSELVRMDDVFPWIAAIRQSLQGRVPAPEALDEWMEKISLSHHDPLSELDALDEWLESIGSDMFQLAIYRLAATGSDAEFNIFITEQKLLNISLMECALGDQPEARGKLAAFRDAARYSDCDWDSYIDCLGHLNG